MSEADKCAARSAEARVIILIIWFQAPCFSAGEKKYVVLVFITNPKLLTALVRVPAAIAVIASRPQVSQMCDWFDTGESKRQSL